jgi:hypothetical protein
MSNMSKTIEGVELTVLLFVIGGILWISDTHTQV